VNVTESPPQEVQYTIKPLKNIPIEPSKPTEQISSPKLQNGDDIFYGPESQGLPRMSQVHKGSDVVSSSENNIKVEKNNNNSYKNTDSGS